MATGASYRFAGFLWVGSIMNSLIVFLPGNIIGKFGAHAKESYFLNIPYVLFPIIFAIRQFRKPSPSAKYRGNYFPARGGLLAFVDFLLVLGLAFLTLLAFFRIAVVLESPVVEKFQWIKLIEPIISCEAKWPKLQLFAHVYYYVPFYIAAIYCLIYPEGKTWFPDWAALFAGASLQGQFSYIFPAVHQIPKVLSTYPNGVWIPVPEAGKDIFWFVNLSVVGVLVILALRACLVRQEYWAVRTQHPKEE